MLRNILPRFTLLLVLFLALPRGVAAQTAREGFSAGPDIISGNLFGLDVYGVDGTQLGLAIGIVSCNAGNEEINFVPMPSINHPVMAQNFYRMSGGSGHDDRFEQVGQAWVKHTYGAEAGNVCEFGCIAPNPPDFTLLGVGCSDTYFPSQSAVQGDLGSRAWINPFTGVFQANARDHTGHNHINTSHMILVEDGDLNPTMNAGAIYYAEIQYITPDEGAWCQAHPDQCNMYNNVSHRRFSIAGTSPGAYSFTAVGAVTRMEPAIKAWTGATINPIEPEPGVDGRAFVASKVTGPVAGVWHYEYAIYNENLDRAIQSFSVPLGCGLAVSNPGFHAPPNHPGFPNDGTQGNAGFSNAAWTSNQTASALSWSTETFVQNQNANALRWGTLYNFRFDSDQPPRTADATVGFFKTGAPVTVAIQSPSICGATPTPVPTATPTPGATPGPAAQATNLSTRMRVQTGDNVGIGGFIITGAAPKHVLLRAIGPSLTQFGVPNVLADPVLELHGPGAFPTINNDNWRDDAAQETAIIATGIPPTDNFEAAIDTTLNPGAYTAVARGKNNTSGVALIEVYDLSPAVPAKLANISTRAFVSTGDNIVIAGFMLGNQSGNDRIVVRGIGPSLTAVGVSNALADPMLELRDGNGTLLMADNDWQDNPSQAAELGAAGLAPTNPLESAIAMTLPPGLYTALLTGLNNSAGVGLVEVYDRGMP